MAILAITGNVARSANDHLNLTCMTTQIQERLWSQFGASIDMLHNAILSCPDTSFTIHNRFYYLAYHSVVLLDYYLTIPPKDFLPTLTFTIKEARERPSEAIGDMVPDRLYSKQELIDYLSASRVKCERLLKVWRIPRISISDLQREMKRVIWIILF